MLADLLWHTTNIDLQNEKITMLSINERILRIRTQVPPIGPCSTIATLAPRSAALLPHASPPDPAPRTRRSNERDAALVTMIVNTRVDTAGALIFIDYMNARPRDATLF